MAMRDPFDRSEHEHCRALIEWTRLPDVARRYPELDLLIHIPNEDRPGPRQRRMAEIGMRAGVSDYFLPAPRGGWHGLWLEMKKPGGRPTKHQLAWLDSMLDMGYCARICHGSDAAIATLLHYLEEK